VSANLDLVRSIYANWECGDFSATEWAHPEIECVLADGPSPGRWTGMAGMAEFAHEWMSAWDDWRLEAEECRELDSERVLVSTLVSGRGKTSGLDLRQAHMRGTDLFHISDGKVTRYVVYLDLDRALADLGVEDKAKPEKSTTPDLVELARRLVDAGNARDTAGTPRSDQDRIDAVMSFFAPDAVFDMGEGFEVLEGRPAVRGFFEDWLRVYDEFELHVEDVRDLGNGVVFSVVVQRGKPRGSAGWVHNRHASVGTWVDGLIERTTAYVDIDEARSAAERLAEERE
jgi:ketosteroid isomerase-like protein